MSKPTTAEPVIVDRTFVFPWGTDTDEGVAIDIRDDGAVLTDPESMQCWWTAGDLRKIADKMDSLDWNGSSRV